MTDDSALGVAGASWSDHCDRDPFTPAAYDHIHLSTIPFDSPRTPQKENTMICLLPGN